MAIRSRMTCGQGNARGVTLIELMVVMAILAILATIGFQFRGWQARYRIEKDIKAMYVDLINARARAMQTNHVHFVNAPTKSTSYTIFADSDPAPDGNGEFSAADELVVQRDMGYQIYIQAQPNSSAWFMFNKNGIITNTTSSGVITRVTIKLMHPASINPDFDCIDISRTRSNLGFINPPEEINDSWNCISK